MKLGLKYRIQLLQGSSFPDWLEGVNNTE
jgi:hypothetical protein